MSTYKASFRQLLNQGIAIHFRQNQSETIIKCTRPSPSSYPQSQNGLYLDISLRDSSKNEQNWPSFQYHLKQVFDQIIQLQNYPNSAIKIFIFVVEQGRDIKACIINGLWLLLLKIGVNMKKSIFCWQKAESHQLTQINEIEFEKNFEMSENRVIYDLNDVESVIEGEMTAQQINNYQENIQNHRHQLSQYKNFVLETMKSTLFN